MKALVETPAALHLAIAFLEAAANFFAFVVRVALRRVGGLVRGSGRLAILDCQLLGRTALVLASCSRLRQWR